MHNINSIKGNSTKLHHLLQNLYNYDIIGICETNITKQKGIFINKQIAQYGKCIFSLNSQKKVKGSGLALFFTHSWIEHIGKVDNLSDFMLSVKLYFKQCIINIVLVYAPPNDKDAIQYI